MRGAVQTSGSPCWLRFAVAASIPAAASMGAWSPEGAAVLTCAGGPASKAGGDGFAAFSLVLPAPAPNGLASLMLAGVGALSADGLAPLPASKRGGGGAMAFLGGGGIMPWLDPSGTGVAIP